MPSYRLHKQSGQAIVTLPDGSGGRRDFLLGPYDSSESRQEYARLIGEWEANHRHLLPEASGASDLSISEVLLRFLEHAEGYYPPSGHELEKYKLAFRPLQRLYGHTLARQFGPKALKALQHALASGSWLTDEEKAHRDRKGYPPDLCRNVVNSRIRRIKHLFAWAESEELVPPSTLHALQTVRGLPKGRGAIRETTHVASANREQLESILPFCERPVATMLQLQYWSGMRSGEVRIMRTMDIDQSNPTCWLYRPSHHKNAWREKEQPRVVPLSPKCIAILQSWLRLDNPEEYLFQPLQARQEQSAKRRALRKTPLTPSQRKRQPKANPKRRPGNRYSDDSYAHAVARACTRQNIQATRGQGLTVRERHARRVRFHSYMLRHGAKMWIEREAGTEAARAILGHRSINTTQHYGQLDIEKAIEVAAKFA